MQIIHSACCSKKINKPWLSLKYWQQTGVAEKTGWAPSVPVPMEATPPSAF
jgi:hypothetical protein